ncbi:FtsX-like permease family protein [Yinghuangia soli]|uniref:FtsX-like permease family protein n=1 Tax=Yinghuangia soli TaxID=2908204 RepID=A0AA41TYU0_9ACTN|nr:FtsX-like permease family protein [Yinghuangia soli]MCF2526786.1 FtsX-like permease family protein [Yinghuangia soli]
MLRLAFGTLRARLAGFAGAFLAVALATVLVTGAGVMLESVLRTHAPVERLSGTDLAVAASDKLERTPAMGKGSGEGESEGDKLQQTPRLPAGLAARIAAVPGVQAAVPDRTVPVALPGGLGAEAHGWDSAQLTPYRLTAGTAPQTGGQIVLDAPTAAALGAGPGTKLEIGTPKGARSVTVSGIAEGRGATAVFLAPQTAAELGAVPDRADFIGITLAPGADAKQVRAAVKALLADAGPQFGDPTRGQPKAQVLSGGSLARLEAPAATTAQEATVPVVAVFGGSAAFTAIFVVAGTFGFSIRQRTREIGLLRAVGATPGQVRRMIAAEALLVALAAAALAVPLGYGFAHVLAELFDKADALPPGFTIVKSWLPGVVGAGSALLVTQIAAFAAAARAAKLRPTEVFGATAKRRILVPLLRYGLGVLTLAGGAALLAVSMNLGGDDGASSSIGIVFTLMLAVALLGLPIARVGVALVGRLVNPAGGAAGRLARANGAAEPGRVAAVAVPVALTIAFSCSVLFIGTTVADETIAQSKARTSATYVVDGTGRAGLAPDAVDRIRALPGVAAAAGTVATTVMDGSVSDALELDARGVGPDTAAVMDLGVRAGDLADLRGPDTVALGSRHAEAKDKGVGDRIRYWLGDGTPMEARVVALYDNAFGFGDYLMPQEVAAAHSTASGYDKVFVTAAPGADRAALTAELAKEGRVMDRAAYLDEVADDANEGAWANAFILGAIAVFTALGVVNTIVMATASRAREFAVLRLAGTTRRQVTAMLRREFAVAAAVGIGIGTGIAWLTLGAFANGITGRFDPAMPPAIYLPLVAATVALIYGSGLLAARSALRRDPVEAIGARD